MLRFSVVKSQLRVPHDDDDARIQWCMDRSEKIITDYLKVADDAYTAATLPFHVEAAMILVAEQLYDGKSSEDPITPAVVSLLMRSRDPAVA